MNDARGHPRPPRLCVAHFPGRVSLMMNIPDLRRCLAQSLGIAAAAVLVMSAAQRAEALSPINPAASPVAKVASEALMIEIRDGHGGGGPVGGGPGGGRQGAVGGGVGELTGGGEPLMVAAEAAFTVAAQPFMAAAEDFAAAAPRFMAVVDFAVAARCFTAEASEPSTAVASIAAAASPRH